MKTIYTLTTLVLIALSFNGFADDKLKSKEKTAAVSVAPFIWGDPDTEAPVELASIKAKNAFVPVAPFVWGSPEEASEVSVKENLIVPVAPFVFGTPDAEVPAGLGFIKAKNANVPVAPFEFGNPELEIPNNI